MSPFRSLISHTSRLLAAVLVATLCAVASEQTTPVRAAGAGIIDYYATLNGSSYFQAPDAAAFDLTGNMTVEMWIRPSNVACMTSSTYCQLINKENSYEFGISGGKFEYALTNSSGSWTWYATDAFLQANVWHHIAFVVSRSTNTITVYYNGEQTGTTTGSTQVPTTGSNSAGAFSIGNRQAFNETYTGDIDEVRLYSGVRSQANIRQDMYTYGTTNATNLVAYYDFNENSATLVNDAPSAATGTNLTRYGTVAYTDVKTVSNPASQPGRTVISFPRSYITSNGGWTVPSGVTRVDALVVAGGGGGGGGQDDSGWSGGGGGAGGLRTVTNSAVTPGLALTLAVGGGGQRGIIASSSIEALPSNGAASIFGSTSTIGGGFGGMNNTPASTGGSGGGGGTYAASATAANGTSGEGNAGGAGAAPCCGGGGGGGAGGVGGGATTSVGGTAGNGVSNSITGTATFYAAGGAGNGTNTKGSAGSTGGTAVGVNATTGTGSGGGGGGGHNSGTWSFAGHGGSGVVIVSYASPVAVDSTNRSLRFTGTAASKVTVPDNNAIDLTKDFTIEAWIYPTTVSGTHVYLVKEGAYTLYVQSGYLRGEVYGGGTVAVSSGTDLPITVNTWNHVAMVKTGSRVTLMKNGGTIAGGIQWTGTGYAENTTTNGNQLEIGARAAATQPYSGYVDDVRLWSYSRSSAAVAQNYNKRVASNVLYFPFDESGGTTVANHAASTGSVLNGVNTNAVIENAWPTVTNTYSAANVSGFLPGYDYHAGGAVTYSITSNGAKGTATVSASTGAFSYVANEGATGNDTFTYGVSGVNGTSTFTYTVSAPSQPMASSKTFRQASDVAATLNTATSLGYNNPSTAFTAGETVRATLSVTNGTVNLALNGTSLVSGTLGSSTFTIDGTQSQINTALNSATVTATSAIPTRVTLDIGMKPASQTISSRTYTYNSNGHFYTRITPSSNTYAVAQSNAAGMSLGGRTGYLATIQHSGENATISGINGTNSWLGANDRPTQGTYRWQGNDTKSIFRISPNAYRSRYNNWSTSEPNGETGGEDFIEQTSTGAWNDCQDACNRNSAIVEFDPVSSRTVTNLDFARSLAATASSARNLGLGTTFLNTSTWANGETVRATFTASAGTVAYTAGATTLVSGASASATVTFEGAVAAMNTALNTVTITNTSTGNSTVAFTFGVKRATTGSYVYNSLTDHFYLSNTGTANYSTAQTNAATAKWAGTSGYLVTVTSESEYNTVRNLNSIVSWSGGTDSVSEGQWAWESPDAFQNYSDFENGLAGAVSYFDPTGEPNGGDASNGMVVNFGTSQSHWDDQPLSTASAAIYEFAPIDSTLTYNITTGSALTITTPTTGLAATNGTAYSLTLSSSGGAGTNVFALASGSLPSGLGLNSSTGVISGTTSGGVASNAITVSVTDANSAAVTTSSFTLTSIPQPCVTTSTVVGAYTVERITTTGSCNWTVPSGVTSIDTFIVGGGGGGGADGGAGGGGGAYQPVAGYSVAAGDAITATIGTGGSAGVWGGNATGSSGAVSSLSKNGSFFATANGGSGGIGGPSGAIGAGGTSTNGFAGGAGGAASTSGGTFGGVGKNGASSYFLGTVAYYGGGGGGGAYGSTATSSTAPCNNAGTAGGLGGGGSAGNRSGTTHTAGCDGVSNTGGGGGGGMAAGPQTSGGAGGSGIAMIRYTTDPLDAYPASITGMQGRYITEDFQVLDTSRRAWVDSSGNGRSVTTFAGSPSISSSGVGASKTVRTVSGGTTAELTWPSSVMPNSSTYTLFHVARYSGASKARIFQAVGGNWLSGFWQGQAGVAFHNAWVTSQTSNASTSGWVLSSDQNNLYRANGKQHSSASGTYSGPLSINTGFNGTEDSDWQVAEVIMYNRELSAAEIRQVESYLARTYGLLGFDTSDATQGVLSPRSFTTAKSGTASTGSSSQLALSWTAPQDTTSVTGYKVEYKKTSDTTWTTFSASTAGTSVTVTGLDAGTAYDTRVTPVDSGATNRPSALASATTWATSSIALGTMPANPSIGGTYILTANVTGPTSTGTVRFMSGGETLSACGTTSVISGVASCSWSPTTQGTQNITATYSGDTSYLESTTAAATAVTVDYAACATTSATTGRFTYLRVTQTGTCKISSLPSGVESVDVFVVGGGGGGGENVGSGGSGGGAYYAERVAATSSSSLTVTIGAGGRAGGYPTDSTSANALRDGGNGEATSISWSTNTFTGNGGIGGQTHWADNKCGGVGWTNTTVPGGTGSGSGGTAFTGGTGGLDGAASGLNASAGGNGFSNSITGVSTPFGGGGGGGAWGGGLAAAGGSGGGGAGAGSNLTSGTSGTANTGGGGGGGSSGCAAGGAGGSGIAIVRYANVPTITSQPAAITKSSGQSHAFSVTPSATGAVSGDYTYQWRKNGVNISGATASSLVLANLVIADADTYSVVIKSYGVTGAVSTVTSAGAVLTMTKGAQTITFGTLADRIYGVSPFALSATSSASLEVTLTSTTTGICTLSGSTLTILSNGTCSITASQVGDVNYDAAINVIQSFIVATKALTITGMTATNKEYDRGVAASISLSSASLVGVQSGDTVTIDSTAATGSFANKVVAAGKTVTASSVALTGAHASRYNLTQPTALANITAKALTVSGITANNRDYDGTTNATALLLKGSAALVGVISTDAVTLSTLNAAGVFASKSVGANKTITISGLTISGDDAANYTLTQPTTTASIGIKTITVTGITATNRIYDSTTNATSLLVSNSAALAGVESGDTVTLSTANIAGIFADKNVGTSKTITISGLTISGANAAEYTLTQPTTTASITAKELTVTGITATGRVYDAGVVATTLLVKGSAVLVGKQGSDDVVLSTANAAATFANKNIGTDKTISITGITVSGVDIANYTLTQPSTTASITAKGLTVSGITATNRVYDSTVAATDLLVKTSATLVGVETNDVVTLTHSAATATFANKTIGTNKPITIAGITISGTDAVNYTLTQPSTSASITAKGLTVSNVTATSRTYDRTTVAALNTGAASLVGTQGSDNVTINTSAAAGAFTDKTVTLGKAVTITGITIGGTDAGNYTLTQPATTADITAKGLTVSGITATSRVYDSTVSATDLLVKTSAALIGVETNDVVTLTHSAATATFANKNIGTNKPITIAGITISGTDAANYSLTQPSTSASITAKTLTVSGITATSRIYNSSDSATALLVKTSAALVGVETIDVVTLTHSAATATFANKNIGTNKPITIAGITIGGTDAGNYTLTQPATTADITAKELTVSNVTAISRVYDRTTVAALNTGAALLVGKEVSDTVTINVSGAAGSFATKTVALGKAVTITGITIGGTDAGNYTLTQPATTADITAKNLTVSGITAADRTYAASRTATLSTGLAAFVGVVAGDAITINTSAAAGLFDTAAFGTDKTVAVSGVTIDGADAANYTVTQPSVTASIVRKILTVTGITATNRIYDASAVATSLLVKTSAALSGVESGDTVTLNHSAATATFANKNIGTNKTIAITGITIGGTEAGNYTLTQPTTSASITAKTLTVSGITANDRIYNADTSATSLLVKGLATLVGKQGSDDVVLSTTNAAASFADKNIGTNKPITITGITISGTDAGNYTLTQPSTSASITAKTLTVSGITATNRVYNASDVATSLLVKTSAALVGVETDDVVTLTHSAATATFANKNIGTNKPITIAGITTSGTDAANYTLTQPSTTASITAKELTVSGITAGDRVYNSSVSATDLLVKGSAALVGKQGSDTVTLSTANAAATFADKTIGTNKPITITGITISGADAGNYTLTQPGTSASITAKELTVSGITATNRVYNSSDSATNLLVKGSAALVSVETNDNVTLDHTAATASFANKNIGTNKPITITGITIGGTDAGNYTLTQPGTSASITAAVLTVSGITATDRVYDSTISATDLLVKGSAALVGKQGSDVVTLDHSGAVATFANKNIGTNKPISITGITIGGTDAGNYTLTQPATSASITAKELTVSNVTAVSRVYDRTTVATLNTGAASLVGKEGSDVVTISASAATGAFADKLVATGKLVTIAGITIGGTDADNYRLTQPTTTANITAKNLTVSGITAADRTYATTRTATLATGLAEFVGVVSGDAITINTSAASGLFDSSAFGTGKTVTVSGVTIDGADAANYTVTQPLVTASIARKVLTVSGITATGRVYDSSAVATSQLVKTSAELVGIETGDTVTLDHSGAAATFADKTIGTNKAITITGITISGSGASNYTLTQPSTTASITAKELTVSGITAADRIYNASTSATAQLVTTSAALVGKQGSDVVTLTTTNAAATFANKNIGNNKPVTITGITISGTDAGNYTLTQPGTSASITAKELTVTGVTATDKVYDSFSSATALLAKSSAELAGVETDDVVTLDHTAAAATFANKNIGNNKTVTITGITISGTDAGNYTLTQPGTSASITARGLTVSNVTAVSRIYDSTTVAALNSGAASLVGTQGSDTVTINTSAAAGAFSTKAIGTGKAVTITGITIGGTDAGNYTLTQPSISANVTAKELTVSGITANDRIYNAGSSATSLLVKGSAALVGKQGSDIVTLSTTNAIAAFADKNIGTNKTITIAGLTIDGTDAGNYTLTQPTTTGSITVKNLTVSGITATDRVYNATTNATTLLSKGTAALVGLETDDIVTLDHSGAAASFATKTVGNNKPITIIGITISGIDATNYTLTQPSATASVTRKELTVNGITAATKIFDGTTSADITTTNTQLVGQITNDDVLLVVSSATGSFADTTVANGRTVQIAGLTVTGADASNYLLTQPTTTADLISASAGLTWSTPTSVVYGTNLSTTQLNAIANVAGVFVYTPASGTRLPVGTHTLSVAFTPTNSAYDPDTTTVSIVVTSKVLTVTGITASDRIYDNTRNAASLLNTNSAALSGVVSGDTINLNRNNATGQFPNPHIGNNKTVSVTGLTISGDVSNYTLTQPTTTASITAKELTISNVSAISKVYNRSTAAELNTGAALLQGVVGSDSVTLLSSSAVGLFNDFNVGTGKSVSSSGFSISGDVSNYTLIQPSTTANITAKELTVSGITANDRVYNASANATAQLVKTSAALVGVETSDSVTIDPSAALATFANKNIGSNKSIAITGIAIGGANVSNYTLIQPTTSASITAKSLTVSGISARNRVYNATTDATSLLNTDSASLVGTQGSDVVNLSVANATATFDTKNVGTGKTISIDALSISGTDSANYTLTQPTTSASITVKALTVSGIAASNKVYNASTAAAINTNSSSLVGIESGDIVLIDNSGTTAVFSSPNVGNNITVLISGVAATGTDASNYSITQPSRNANITEASASLSWSDPSDLVFGVSLSATQLNATAGVSGVFSYSPTAGTRLDVGTHPLQVTFTPTSSNYAVATQTVSIIVTRKSVTVTANPVSITYGSSLSMSYSVTGLEGADSDSGVTYTYAGTGSTSYAGSTTAPAGAGTYSVTPSQLVLSSGLTSNYTITYVPANLTISKATQASLVASAATYTMTYAPTPNEPTISLAANGGSGNGAITYTITSSGGNCSVSGSVLTGLLAGSCTVIASRAESANFVARESSPITFTVEKATQELSLNAISNKTYGDSDFAAVATATSGLTVSLTAGPSGICAISSGLTIHIVSNGDCTVSATQAGNSNYLSATTAFASASTRTFAIARKTLTVSGTTISGRTYDQSLSATNLVSYSASVLNGIVANDNVSIDHNAATATFASKTAASNKPVTVTGVTLTGTQASRYVLTQPTGLTATISQAPLSVSGISVPTRGYNTLTTATLNTSNYTFSGVTSGDIVTLDSSSYVADFSTAITGTAKVVTVSGLALTGSDAFNYTLIQPVLQGDIVKATASIEFAVARTTTYNGTPRPLASSSIPSSLALVSSYSGSGQTTYGPTSSAPTNAGAYIVNVNVSDINFEGTASSSWRINKQTISVIADQNALQKAFGGSTHSVPFSTSPSGKNLVITYTGTNGTVYSSSYAPTNAGTYQVTASVSESNFDGSLAPVLTISPATQDSISFVSGATATFGTFHQLVAVGGSGSGALSYTRVSGPCSVNATTGALTTTSVGACVVRADRASSTNYQDASSANHSIQIAKGSQVVTFTSSIPSSSTTGSTYSPTATSSSGLSPTISLSSGANSVCSLAVGVITFMSSGVCEISAAQDGDSNWLAATSEVQVVEIGKLSQAISFTQPQQYELGHPGFIPEASSSSGLAVSVSITSGSSVCAQSNSGLITFLTIGTCSLRATQSGDATFSAASSVSRTVTVLPGLPSAPHISSISAGDGAVTVGYTAVTNNGGSPIVSYELTATSDTAPTVTQSNCDASTLRCTLVGLVNSASYSVSVAAVNIRGKGPSSEALEVLVPSPSTIAVQSVTGVRETTNLDVSWEDPNTYGDGAFVQYEVSVRERGGVFGSPVTVQSLRVRAQPMSPSTLTNIVLSPASGVVQSLTTRARTVRFTNLDPSRLYETKVVTVTSTSTVETANNTTSALVMPLALPSVPRGLQIEATSPSSVQVSWSSPSTDGGTAIQSYAVTTSIGTCVPATPLARTCSIVDLSSDVAISVSVSATNAIGSSIAATSSYSMPTAPNAPTIDLVVTTLTAATITWNAPNNNGGRSITSYSVLGVTPNSQFRCTSTSTSCVINGLTSSTTYSFTVRAVNNIGTSRASAAVEATTTTPAAKPAPAPVAAAPTRPVSSDWSTYRNSASNPSATTMLLPPAPARVSIQSLSGGKRTRVTAIRAVRDNGATITYAIISVSSRTNKLLARIRVQVDPSNPTTSVSVPYASNRVKVAVQFANQVGISSGGPAGVNISEGNTFEWTTANGKATIVGERIPGNIMFAKGSSTISPSMKKSLNKIAATAKARGGPVYVSGFAAPGELASAWLLKPLARARAEAISKYLAKIGVRQWITFHGTSSSVSTPWGTTTGRQAIITTVSASAV